jgi:hypothetical protein
MLSLSTHLFSHWSISLNHVENGKDGIPIVEHFENSKTCRDSYFYLQLFIIVQKFLNSTVSRDPVPLNGTGNHLNELNPTDTFKNGIFVVLSIYRYLITCRFVCLFVCLYFSLLPLIATPPPFILMKNQSDV